MTAARAAVERLRAARDEVTELSLDALTVPELLHLLGELETDRRRQPTVEHRLIQTLRSRCTDGRCSSGRRVVKSIAVQ